MSEVPLQVERDGTSSAGHEEPSESGSLSYIIRALDS
jgi:hypothetical protein